VKKSQKTAAKLFFFSKLKQNNLKRKMPTTLATYFCIFLNQPKENKGPVGKNSPNLVTLVVTHDRMIGPAANPTTVAFVTTYLGKNSALFRVESFFRKHWDIFAS
jgi:hypothetical protein